MILASASPRRRELLASCGVSFSIKSSEADEFDSYCGVSPDRLPLLNARKKADTVAIQYPDELVLGADTLVLSNGHVLGKPASRQDAAEMLNMLSGQTHAVVTGIALRRMRDDFIQQWDEITFVRFKALSPAVILDYLSKVYVLDKAGAYAIQEYGTMLVDSIDGEMENVIGLPLQRLRICLDSILKHID